MATFEEGLRLAVGKWLMKMMMMITNDNLWNFLEVKQACQVRTIK
jgi:hypothetical protein